MKKIVLCLSLVWAALSSASAWADGCYICSGGKYVKFSGSDDSSKRDAAKACGCQITGTRSECDAANLEVICSVDNSEETFLPLACNHGGKNKNGSDKDDEENENKDES